MKILDFPALRQAFEYDCGTSALQAVLTYYGIELSEENLMKYAKTNNKEGTHISGIIHVLKKFKLKYDPKSMTLNEIKEKIDNGIPTIILLQAWNEKSKKYDRDFHDGHWVVAVGYDRNKIVFEDPYSFEMTFLKNKELKERWHAKEEGKKITNYGISVFGKKPKYNSKKIIPMG